MESGVQEIGHLPQPVQQLDQSLHRLLVLDGPVTAHGSSKLAEENLERMDKVFNHW